MRSLFESQNIILDDFEKLPYYNRLYYSRIRLANRINGIVGARGVGKTTFLLKTALAKGVREGHALYISADNLFFLEHSLLALAEWAYKETDIHCICIDEIHKYSNWNQELKNIYDTFANLKILFSGSSMIDIVHSKYDLSRRVTLYPMHGFSFREYLEFYYDSKIEPISMGDLLKKHVQYSQSIHIPKILKHSKDYLKLGHYPFIKPIQYETEQHQAIENIVQKTIYEDIAVLHNLKTTTLLIIEKLYKFVLCSAAGELNINKLSSRIQKDFNDVSKYLSYLEQAGLIHLLYQPKDGKALLGTPIKILPDNTNMLYAHTLPQSKDNLIGKVRETFFINQIKSAGLHAYYTTTGDYRIEETHFEIGGKNKSSKQLKDRKNAFVLTDNIIIGDKKNIPLYLFGFLY